MVKAGAAIILFCLLAAAPLAAAEPVLIVADEFPAMEVLAGKLKAAEGIEARIVDQREMPQDLGKYPAVLVYIHRNIAERTENALIDYTERGGKLVLLHHSISSAKRANKRWLPFLGVKLPEGDWQQGGYKYFDPVTLDVVDIAPREFITTYKVAWEKMAPRYGSFTLANTEVYLNHVLSGSHTLLLGFIWKDPAGRVWGQDTAGWYKKAGAGWVFYFMPGHSKEEFENPAYSRIVVNAVVWKPVVTP